MVAPRRILFTSLAQTDMAAIAEWRRSAPKAAGHLMLELGALWLQLRGFPRSAPKWLHETHRATVLTHSVVYAVESGAVVVLGILPSRADEQLRQRARRWRAP